MEKSFNPKEYLLEKHTKYCKCTDTNFDDLSWNEKFIHLWFMAKIDKGTIKKIIERMKYKIENNDSEVSLEGITRSIAPFETYLRGISFPKLPLSSELFKSLTESQINKIYLKNLPDETLVTSIKQIIDDLSQIVKLWNKD